MTLSLQEQRDKLQVKLDNQIAELEKDPAFSALLPFVKPDGQEQAPMRDFAKLDAHMSKTMLKEATPDMTGASGKEADQQWFKLRQLERQHSEFTYQHTGKVGLYLSELAKEMGHSQEVADLLGRAGDMHDIGKINVADEILHFEGKLDDNAFGEMKKHTTYGAEILLKKQGMFNALSASMALYHHEAYNGEGYFGLEGNQIPYAARLCQVVDIFEAITAERPYKKGMSPTEAISFMKNKIGEEKFDPTMLNKFEKIAERVHKMGNDMFGLSTVEAAPKAASRASCSSSHAGAVQPRTKHLKQSPA